MPAVFIAFQKMAIIRKGKTNTTVPGQRTPGFSQRNYSHWFSGLRGNKIDWPQFIT
jgi:hypothetical protein